MVVGGGLLGGHTARALAVSGRRVTVFSRSFSGWLRAERSRGLEIEFVEGTVPPEDQVSATLAGADVVYCFVGYSTPARSASSCLSSIGEWLLPAVSVLEAAAKGGVRRVVVASSGGTIYGPARVLPTPETHPLDPISAHGSTSLAIETYASFFRSTQELETVALRYANVYGPGERVRGDQGVIAAWCESLALDEPLQLIGDPETRRDFVYAGDAGAAAVAALDGCRPGAYNIGSGVATPLSEVLELIEDVSGRTPELTRREARGVDVPATGLDSSLFTAATGWTPATPLREGIEATWRWTTSASAALRSV